MFSHCSILVIVEEPMRMDVCADGPRACATRRWKPRGRAMTAQAITTYPVGDLVVETDPKTAIFFFFKCDAIAVWPAPLTFFFFESLKPAS